ncbi:MAG: FAD-binding oxidoreductase [Deltaproteobacteria bacterium]|nr:FAD-binding oxidoreductase [Deltaproteobacteria bacterium]
MMVIRPRSVREIVDALTLSRGAHRAIRVGDGAGESPQSSSPELESFMDISALAKVGVVDTASRLVEVELGIRCGRLIDELVRTGFTVGEPMGPPSRLLYHFVAETPDLWRSPRAMTLRDRIVAVRGVLPDGAIFATRDSPRAANGPLVDRLLVGGAPRLVPAILTHATLRLDPLSSAESAKRRAFRLPSIDLVMRLARRAWPQTVEAMAFAGDGDVAVILDGELPDFSECAVPTFELPPDRPIRHRRVLWRDTPAISRPFWAYRVDRWGIDVVIGRDVSVSVPPLTDGDRGFLSSLNMDRVIAIR